MAFKHWTRFLPDVGPNVLLDFATKYESKQSEINRHLSAIKKLENEQEEIDNRAWDELRGSDGWTTEEIAEAKLKAKQHNA